MFPTQQLSIRHLLVGAFDAADLGHMSGKLRSITKKLESEHKKISSGEPSNGKNS